ncbi:DsbA family protein [Maridesulfovibrio sp.]|uniref:DsbA family protein n=1 Tax=Maridesulfovibrio sp. TaxID=2795000 RepID=UPI0039EE3FB4
MPRLTATLTSAAIIAFSIAAGTPQTAGAVTKEEVRIILKENPQLIFEALEGYEEQLYDLLQLGLEKKKKTRIRQGRLEQLKNPKVPALHPDRPVWGQPTGKIQIVVFSDFQSASCAKAYKTIRQLLKKHPGIGYRYRHNPLGLHKMSLPAARYYEAMALQDHAKAKKLNGLILQNRIAIKKSGPAKLDELAEICGADMALLKKTLNSPQIDARINADIKEARKFGFTASPVFLVNGVTITGAAPQDEFEEVLQMIQKN